jgi:hypothetical protein
MTMVKSHTRKKYAKPANEEIRAVSNAATDYIKQWTARELGKIQQAQTSPLCIPVSNGYKIGQYRLTTHPNKTCEVYDHNHELVHIFENKISAMLYTVYTIKRRYQSADEIMVLDKEINKNYTDMLSLRHGIEAARKNKDYLLVDSRLARLEIAETKLTIARRKVSQIHLYAKLAKVWDLT